MCGGIATIVQPIPSTGDMKAPGFVLLWAVVHNISGISSGLAIGEVMLSNECNHIHPICLPMALCQTCKLINAGLNPPLTDLGVGMIEEVSIGHPSTKVLIPN